MNTGTLYEVTKRIKLHTKPLREAEIVQHGKFVKETNAFYYFTGFAVKKTSLLTVRAI